MNGFNRSFMGQVPLILGPSSWGAGMLPPVGQGRVCPEGTFLDENGLCRPRVTMGQNILEYFDVPLGAFPVPWGAGCATGEIRDKDGNCVPDTHQMGQAQVAREGGSLKYFDVPLGAFPVPWNMPCQPGETRDEDGECKSMGMNQGMGQGLRAQPLMAGRF